jgi:apolipoprotein D and lipocalin family protein
MFKFIFLLAATVLLSPQAHAVSTVNYVDLNQYVGKWYEVASIPAWFQKKCVKNTTAEYRTLDFGRIDVINTCEKADGTLNVANGIAHVENTTTQAELKVSFVPFFSFFGWFSGQYKVIALGENYEYSVVGDDTMGFGWILSRTPSLPIETLVALEKKITSVGYDSCQFLMSIQDGGTTTTRIPLCQLVQ